MADFTITTPQEWNDFLQYIYTNNTSSSSTTVTATLQNDIDFSETTYYNSQTNIYNVIVDGNGYKIEKVALAFSQERRGIFIYYAYNSTVKNLTISDWSITATSNVEFFSGESLTLENVHLLNNIINTSGTYYNTNTHNQWGAASFNLIKCSFQSNVFSSGYVGLYVSLSNVLYSAIIDNVELSSTSTAICILGGANSDQSVHLYFSFCRNNFKNIAELIGTRYCQAIACYFAVTFETAPTSTNVFEILNSNQKYISCFYDTEINSEIQISSNGGSGVATAQLQSKAFLKSKGWVF